jgi:hypothetical protein
VNGAIPSEHPDDDLLADLAADVLPTHQARAVEAHVMACPRCTSLLTDAEQVRNLLLTDDPGPVPPDVLIRIDQALQYEVAARDGLADYPPQTEPTPVPRHVLPVQPPARTPTQQVRVISPWEDTSTIEAFEAARKRQAASRRGHRDAENASPTRDASPARDASPTSGVAVPRPHGSRLTRPSRGPSRSRRDAREEVRDVKAGRRGTVLAAAASVIVLLGLGGYVVVGVLDDRQPGAASVAASSVEPPAKGSADGVAGGPPVLTTGTDYTEASLSEQARALVSHVNPVPGQPRSSLQAPAVGARSTSAQVPAPGPSAADAGNQSLRNSAALSGCLAALRAGGRRPVAVDLARFDGRDAAIIVLNGANGGYEVWAVSRDCRPGADGTITYLDLTR